MTSTSSGSSGLTGSRNTRDDVLQAAAHASERAHSYAHDALDQAEEKFRELRGSVDPVVDKLASTAQKLARQSLDMAAEAQHKAQDALKHYASSTSRYVAEQPVRSVLIAAAVGAALALLVTSARNNHRR
jgi:ElaB/YqjD/DUF883 family membrane-anchored ribosome-binding protein